MYKLNRESNRLVKMDAKSFADMAIRERFDIQEWICHQPDILGEEILIIGKEILPGDIVGQKTQIRLDLLALDRNGNLVVIELKRDDSGTDPYWQAIKYAALCSTFSREQILQLLQEHESLSEHEAIERVDDFLEDDARINENQRIILVSKDFHSDAISSVLWLRDSSVDIKCVRLKPYVDSDNDLFLTPEIIIPLAEAKDYIEMKEARHIKREAGNRSSPFSKEVPNLSQEELYSRLSDSLTRDSSLTPRLIKFFKILSEKNHPTSREDMKQALYSSKIGNDIGHSGRLLSNISSFVTKKSNPHLRQILSFESEGDGGPGARKDGYQIKPEYLSLVKDVLSALPENIEATDSNLHSNSAVDGKLPPTLQSHNSAQLDQSV